MSLPGPRYHAAFRGNKKDHYAWWKNVEGWVVVDLHTNEEHPCSSREAARDRAREMSEKWEAEPVKQ